MKVEDSNRCGEIYRIGPEVFAFNCTICNEFFSSTNIALVHIESHFLANFSDPSCTNFDKDLIEDQSNADFSFADESCAEDDAQSLKDESLKSGTLSVAAEAQSLAVKPIKEEPELDSENPTLPAVVSELKNITNKTKIKVEKKTKGKRKSKVATGFKGKDPVSCELCGKILRKDSLKDHLESHSQELKYSCNLCDKKFNTRLNLRNHKYSHNDVRVKYKTKRIQVICHFCGCTFAAKSLLRAHIVRRHTEYKPYKCEVCHKTFAHPTILRTHLRTHSDDTPFKCKMCDEAFKKKPGLDRHMRKIHNADKPYKCKECPNSFMDRRSLVEHIRSHTGEKPYRCEICYNAFSRKPIYTEHMLLHTGLKTYKCNYCDKTFAQRSTCYSHQRSVHKKIPRKSQLQKATTESIIIEKIEIQKETGESITIEVDPSPSS